MKIMKYVDDTDLYRLGTTGKNNAIVIPTNGIVKKDGCAVMGAGLAKQANELFKLDSILGGKINEYGNRVHYLGKYTYGDCETPFAIYSFPTKTHFLERSDIFLIAQSAQELVEYADKYKLEEIFLPKVGCGLGGLSWKDRVGPVLRKILDNRFIVLV